MEKYSLEARVRELVARSGRLQSDYAMAIGIEPTKFSKSLNGIRRFTTFELAAIAQQGGTTVEWLINGVEPELARVASRLAHAETGAPARERAVCRARELAEVNEALDLLTGERKLDPVPSSQASGTAVEQGEQMALYARARLDEEPGNAALLASDAAAAVESVFGVDVAVEKFGPDFDGLAWSTSALRLIVLNGDVLSVTRRRFTLAHELGHILFGDGDADRGYCVDGDVMATEGRHIEIRANAFAAAFLMPEAIVRADAGIVPLRTEMFAALAHRYGVSGAALAWRLRSLGLIDGRRRRELMRLPRQEMARQGGWLDALRLEAVMVRETCSRLPGPLVRRAFDAFENGQIGTRVLAKMLGLTQEIFLEALNQVANGGSHEGEREAFDEDEAVFAP